MTGRTGVRALAARDPRLRGREAGQGLVYVIIAGAVLLVLLMTLVDVLFREMRWIVGTNRRNVMMHAADGAVDRAIRALQTGGNWDAIPKGLIEGYRKDVTYTDIPGIAYTIKVQEGNWTPYPGPNVAKEETWTPSGDLRLQRTVTVYLSNTRTGENRMIQAVVMQTSMDSALFSGGVINVGGSAEVHWGPVVSYSTASNSIDNPKTLDYPIYLSAGGIVIGKATAGNNVPSMDCDDPVAGKCVNEYDTDLGPQPEMPLDYWRSKAKSQGGLHYVSGVCGTNLNPGLPVMDDTSVVFFDSMDAKNYNPLTDTICKGSWSGGNDRGCYLKFTSGPCGKGVLVIMGDLDTAGNGCDDTTLMKAPSNCVGKLEVNAANCQDKTISKGWWNGFVYIANKLTSTGTKMLYGSIYVYDNTGIGGNFSVYYKTNNSGMGELAKTVVRYVWMERAPMNGVRFPSGVVP